MRARAIRYGIAVAALFVFALGAVVAGRSDASPPAPIAAARVLDHLGVVTGGIVTPLVPGAAIEVAGELTAAVEIRVEPRVRYARVLSLRLSAGSGPLEEVTITVAAHMLSMDHGSFVVTALPSGDGGYIARLPFVMPGEWQLELHLASAGYSGDLVLVIEEFD